MATQTPAHARHLARRLAMQALYQWEIAGTTPAELKAQYRESAQDRLQEADLEYFSALLTGILERVSELDSLIAPVSNITPDRLSKVELALLRLGSYELLTQLSIPAAVIIDEAVKLSKTFGAEQGYRYVNAVLDKLALQVRPDIQATRQTPSSSGEFDLIQQIRHALREQPSAAGSLPAIGDDAAVLSLSPNKELVISSDLFVSDIHYPAFLPAAETARHCLSAGLSDLAAMGASPLAMTLAVSSRSRQWVIDLIAGCVDVIKACRAPLVGGDLSEGPNSLCVTVLGELDKGKALTRSGAADGDDIWLSGHTGEAAAGLILLKEKEAGVEDRISTKAHNHLIRRFCQPNVRIELGTSLVGRASAAIDISDGLLADLGHLLTASGLGGELKLNELPVSSELREFLSVHPECNAKELTLAGGDDYELCFTAAPGHREQIRQLGKQLKVALHCIGSVCQEKNIRLSPEYCLSGHSGYQHFRSKEKVKNP